MNATEHIEMRSGDRRVDVYGQGRYWLAELRHRRWWWWWPVTAWRVTVHRSEAMRWALSALYGREKAEDWIEDYDSSPTRARELADTA